MRLPTQSRPLCAIRNTRPAGLICSFSLEQGGRVCGHSDTLNPPNNLMNPFLPSFPLLATGAERGSPSHHPPLPAERCTQRRRWHINTSLLCRVLGQVVEVRSRETECDPIPGHEGVAYVKPVRKSTAQESGLRGKQRAVESVRDRLSPFYS